MSINTSQGQTLKNVGVFLPQPVFSHGQLYVAVTRVSSWKAIKFLFVNNEHMSHGKMPDSTYLTHNVVFHEVLDSH